MSGRGFSKPVYTLDVPACCMSVPRLYTMYEGSAMSEISYTAIEINMKSSEIRVKSSPEI